MRVQWCRCAPAAACALACAAVAHAATAAAADAAASCTSALDCSLNGDCVASACVCDAAWAGSPNCDVMAFDPVDKGAMPGYYNATEASWGGYPVSDSTGGYYLFHAQMAHHCPLGSWKSNSIVARSRSVSGEVQGPYAFDSLVQAPFAHNPTIRRAANGTYVIYFIGSWQTNASTCTSPDANAAWPTATPAGSSAAAQPADAGALRDHIDSSPAACTGLNWPKTCGPDMPGPMGDCCGPEDAPYQGNGGCGIAMASSATLDGPWTVQPLKISDQWRSNEVYCTHTNPAPVFLPNGTVVM